MSACHDSKGLHFMEEDWPETRMYWGQIYCELIPLVDFNRVTLTLIASIGVDWPKYILQNPYIFLIYFLSFEVISSHGLALKFRRVIVPDLAHIRT